MWEAGAVETAMEPEQDPEPSAKTQSTTFMAPSRPAERSSPYSLDFSGIKPKKDFVEREKDVR